MDVHQSMNWGNGSKQSGSVVAEEAVILSEHHEVPGPQPLVETATAKDCSQPGLTVTGLPRFFPISV